MSIEKAIPAEFTQDLGYLGPQDVPHLMACIVGLGGEVFMLKAELERMRRALQDAGGITPQAFDAAGSSASFQEWLQQEQEAFGKSLLSPFLQSARQAGRDTE